MKSIIMPNPVTIGTEQSQDETKKQRNLDTVEVKETIANPHAKDNLTKFTAVDMWNCNRQSRSASSMMRWNLN